MRRGRRLRADPAGTSHEKQRGAQGACANRTSQILSVHPDLR
jgi:hypothetical protein